MFGYIATNPDELAPEEKERYQQTYCGLCRTLGIRHGQLSRLSLTYDMTFLILFLSSLYEPKDIGSSARCVIHPLKKHPYLQNACTDYAADMTVALIYYKCLDDWTDERNLVGCGYAKLLQNCYKDVNAQWPRQCTALESGLKRLGEVEAAWGPPDEAAGAFGAIMGEVFAWRADMWGKPMRQFGDALGRFIYYMDAAVDYENDKRRGKYNPLVILGQTPEDFKPFLLMLIGRAAGIFEKLPLVQDVHLLRNILYAGVWQKYNAQQKGSDGHGR